MQAVPLPLLCLKVFIIKVSRLNMRNSFDINIYRLKLTMKCHDRYKIVSILDMVMQFQKCFFVLLKFWRTQQISYEKFQLGGGGSILDQSVYICKSSKVWVKFPSPPWEVSVLGRRGVGVFWTEVSKSSMRSSNPGVGRPGRYSGSEYPILVFLTTFFPH